MVFQFTKKKSYFITPKIPSSSFHNQFVETFNCTLPFLGGHILFFGLFLFLRPLKRFIFMIFYPLGVHCTDLYFWLYSWWPVLLIILLVSSTFDYTLGDLYFLIILLVTSTFDYTLGDLVTSTFDYTVQETNMISKSTAANIRRSKYARWWWTIIIWLRKCMFLVLFFASRKAGSFVSTLISFYHSFTFKTKKTSLLLHLCQKWKEKQPRYIWTTLDW